MQTTEQNPHQKYDEIFKEVAIKRMSVYNHTSFKRRFKTLYECIMIAMDKVESNSIPIREETLPTHKTAEQYNELHNDNII